MKRRVALLLLMALALFGCSRTAPPEEPPSSVAEPGEMEESGEKEAAETPVVNSDQSDAQIPGDGELLIERSRVIADVVERINDIAPTSPGRDLHWRVERMSVLAPRYVLVWYTEGHTARLTLFRVDDVDGQYVYQPILDGEPDLAIPVDWDWRARP